MRYFIIIAFCLVTAKAMAQESDTVLFTEEVDTATIAAEPIGGYKRLLRALEQKISAGDTIGKKTSIPLYAIRIHINEKGGVDTAYVNIPHAACSIHRMIIQELLKTKWRPAKERGHAVPYESELFGNIQLTKAVQKKFKCLWR
jgi:hypothetical protein